jgi:hypothetical protein
MDNGTAKKLIWIGPIFGLAPIIISLIAAPFGSDIGMVLPWLTIATLPLGIIVSVIGVVFLLVNTSKSTSPKESTGLAASPDSPAFIEGTGQNSKVKVIRLLYTLGAALILANTLYRLFVLQTAGGILYVFEFLPVGFAIWLAIEAWKLAKNGGESFLQFNKMQRIVAVVGIVLGIPNILFAVGALSLEQNLDLGMTEADYLANLQSAITGMIPFVASVLSLVFMLWAKKFYKTTL